jgi:hypothetical protein
MRAVRNPARRLPRGIEARRVMVPSLARDKPMLRVKARVGNKLPGRWGKARLNSTVGVVRIRATVNNKARVRAVRVKGRAPDKVRARGKAKVPDKARGRDKDKVRAARVKDRVPGKGKDKVRVRAHPAGKARARAPGRHPRAMVEVKLVGVRGSRRTVRLRSGARPVRAAALPERPRLPVTVRAAVVMRQRPSAGPVRARFSGGFRPVVGRR